MMKDPLPKLARILLISAALTTPFLSADRTLGCEAGVCDGTVTGDGRPICWKLRVQVDTPNDLHYFAAGLEHYEGLGPAAFSYLGAGPHDDSQGGPARQGVNSRGLAIGFNAFNGGDWQELHHFALGQAATTAQVDTHLADMTTLGTIHYYIDAAGDATLWESDIDPSGHWAYNTRAPARADVLRDFDGDGDEISYAGWVGRANTIYMHTDATDSLLYGEEDRTAAAQTVPGRLVDGGAMNVRTLASEYFRHDVLATDNSVSSMIVHGVRPDEDPRLTTMWTALGHAEAAIFVPVWIHGIEADGTDAVPDHLDHGSGACVYEPAKGLITDGVDEDALQLRTLPVESHFFDLVLDELLPEWRARDWHDGDVADGIGHEMKRVQERMDADAYSLLDCLYATDPDNHAPRRSRIDAWTVVRRTVDLAATAIDDDGTIIEAVWNYGDGYEGTADTHEYDLPGTYLVSFTATDDDSVSFTDWEFVVVPAPTAAPEAASDAFAAVVLKPCHPNPFNPGTVISFVLPQAARVRLSVYDLSGRLVRTLLHDSEAAAGRNDAYWNGRNDSGRRLEAGVYLCRLEAGAFRATGRMVMLK
ncbi:T9SS type A sorting domain-containing protein [bacterium]|nr:T9SS type A sorting domain-containing protein [bacterium]